MPPLAEQERIVAEVERRLSVIEKADAAVQANLKRAERMRQAILKRAFEGNLVPQDPNDEPASVLLGRIRTDREQVAVTASKRRRHRSVIPAELAVWSGRDNSVCSTVTECHSGITRHDLRPSSHTRVYGL